MQNFTETKEYFDVLTMLKAEVKNTQLRADLAIRKVSEATSNCVIFETFDCRDWVVKKLKAVLATLLTREVILLYWQIGKAILEYQEKFGEGNQVIEALSESFRCEFPDVWGLDSRNLNYMRKFSQAYPNFEFVQQFAARLPWPYHVVLMKKLKTPEERLFYIQKTIENGWCQNILTIQIDSHPYEQQEKATSCFMQSLPRETIAQLPTSEQFQNLCEGFKDLFEGFKDEKQESD